MAFEDVGFGKASAAIQTAIDAATDGGVDTVRVFDSDAFGNRVYNEVITINKDVIVRSESKIRKYLITREVTITSDCTFQDFNIRLGKGDADGIDANTAGITVTIERGYVGGQVDWGIICGGSGTTVTINNVITFDAASGGGRASFLTFNGAVCVYNYCMSVKSPSTGFMNHSTPGTMTCNNCISFADAIDFSGTIGGKKNATNQSSGAPGDNPVHNLTLTDLAFARDESPSAGTQFPLYAFRSIETAMNTNSSALQDAGSSVAGVTEDIDGRARDGSTPNIGPTEDFDGLGAAAGGLLSHSGMSGGMIDLGR